MTEGMCLFFGCWGSPGHYLFAPSGGKPKLTPQESYDISCKLDGALAPSRTPGGSIVYGGHMRARYGECPQGVFLRHRLDEWSLLQWWDRNQGDARPACNSTILLRGEHTSEELLEALAHHFPQVLRRLEDANVFLVEVFVQHHT